MLRIGLTGGIGSGKSTVAELFAQRGVPVIDADRLAHELVAPGTPALAQIVQAFGEDVLGDDGALDRRALRRRVFADATARERLEAILHPAIRARSDAELEALERSGVPYAINVIPLLVETRQQHRFDRVLVVDVPLSLQRERVTARDHTSAQEVERVLGAQASRAERLAAADDVILNAGTLEELEAQVARLHGEYLRLAAQQ